MTTDDHGGQTELVSPTFGELKRMLDKLIWAHEQVRRHNPDASRVDRITEAGNMLCATTDYGTLTLLTAIAVDRLTEPTEPDDAARQLADERAADANTERVWRCVCGALNDEPESGVQRTCDGCRVGVGDDLVAAAGTVSWSRTEEAP